MDTYQAYRIFTDVWRFYRRHSKPTMDEAYWHDVVREAEELRKRYQDLGLCEELLAAVINVLDRQARKEEKHE